MLANKITVFNIGGQFPSQKPIMQWFNFMVIYMKRWQKEQLSGFVAVQTDLKSCREENIGGFFCKRFVQTNSCFNVAAWWRCLLSNSFFFQSIRRVWLSCYLVDLILSSRTAKFFAVPVSCLLPRYWLAKATRSSAALSDPFPCRLLLVLLLPGSMLPACLCIDKGIAHEISGPVNP